MPVTEQSGSSNIIKNRKTVPNDRDGSGTFPARVYGSVLMYMFKLGSTYQGMFTESYTNI